MGDTKLLTWENESFEKVQGGDNNNKLEQMLFLFNLVYVGDEVYHEITMQTDDFPKSYVVKQLQQCPITCDK